eukprot:6199989-Pleurochrysis_carterae.AAC.1
MHHSQRRRVVSSRAHAAQACANGGSRAERSASQPELPVCRRQSLLAYVKRPRPAACPADASALC